LQDLTRYFRLTLYFGGGYYVYPIGAVLATTSKWIKIKAKTIGNLLFGMFRQKACITHN
jgi:hypothetical protein